VLLETPAGIGAVRVGVAEVPGQHVCAVSAGDLGELLVPGEGAKLGDTRCWLVNLEYCPAGARSQAPRRQSGTSIGSQHGLDSSERNERLDTTEDILCSQ
jgi:hypothetical protein